jgi:C-terminal processing protease CtpA/Prc
VDWKAVRDKYKPRVLAETKPEELFGILQEMIEPLHDAHTFLGARSISKQFHGERPDPHHLNPRDFERAGEIIKKHLRGELRSACNGKVSFGMLDDSVGYLRITGFAGYTAARDFDKEVEALDNALDEALRDTAKWRGLVVDVRLNGGGSDVLGVQVASRLATHEYLAFAKKARSDPNDPAKFTPLQETQVRPSKKPHFGGKVVLLTGQHSVSAAETFTMALMGRKPEVTRVGENTQGVFSDVLGRTLPNGWRFGLPNEIFLTESGQAFDGPGIPPHVAVPVFPREDLEKGRDDALEKALQILAGK